jgi:hypothetical protein
MFYVYHNISLTLQAIFFWWMWPSYSRAVDVRLSDCSCSISNIWVPIPSRDYKQMSAPKSYFNTWGLFSPISAVK